MNSINSQIQIINSTLNNITPLFKPITLYEMDKVKFMNRIDKKYFFNSQLLFPLLKHLSDTYKILEINNCRNFVYKTTYFDTCGFDLYNMHVNGRLNRFKVRNRVYETGNAYFEIKFKNNKKRTIKSRVLNNNNIVFNNHTEKLLTKKTPFVSNHLQEILQNGFNRITLVNNEMNARITFDTILHFNNTTNSVVLPNIAIAEIKQDGTRAASEVSSFLKSQRVFPGGISKYCLGAALLYPELKINNIKPKLLKIKQLHNDTDVIIRQS